MGLHNKHGLGCDCCCFARMPDVKESIEFYVEALIVNPNGSFFAYKRLWTYLGRSEDVYNTVYEKLEETQPGSAANEVWRARAELYVGHMWGEMITGGGPFSGIWPGAAIVVFGEPLDMPPSLFVMPGPAIALYGIESLRTEISSHQADYVVDEQCKRYARQVPASSHESNKPYVMSVFRRVHRPANG